MQKFNIWQLEQFISKNSIFDPFLTKKECFSALF